MFPFTIFICLQYFEPPRPHNLHQEAAQYCNRINSADLPYKLGNHLISSVDVNAGVNAGGVEFAAH